MSPAPRRTLSLFKVINDPHPLNLFGSRGGGVGVGVHLANLYDGAPLLKSYPGPTLPLGGTAPIS